MSSTSKHLPSRHPPNVIETDDVDMDAAAFYWSTVLSIALGTRKGEKAFGKIPPLVGLLMYEQILQFNSPEGGH